ncbi:MAG: hypothetical protein U0136_18505 [Bdellovibrionota bacterium]
MLLLVPIPVVEMSAHYSGYVVQILEFRGRYGCGIRRLGLLAIFLTPLSMWLTYAVALYWSIPFLVSITATILCGRALEHIVERRVAWSNVVSVAPVPRGLC